MASFESHRRATATRAALGLAVVLSAPVASAQDSGKPARASPVEAKPAERPHRYEWRYPRFRLWQYISSAGISSVNLYMEFVHADYKERHWTNGVLFDDAARDLLRADTEQGRKNADFWSDVFWHPVQYYTVVVDSLLVPLAFDRGNVDVAFQMSMTNWQAIGLSFFLIRGGHLVLGRARPSLQGCSDAPGSDNPCSTRGSAFPSGHTGMAATGAGLACAHHRALKLYGNDVADAAICVILSLGAAANGYFRIVSDKHWATDVVLGYGIGLAVGYGVPTLLHYNLAKPNGDGAGSRRAPAYMGGGFLPENTAFVPMIGDDVWGVSFVGVR